MMKAPPPAHFRGPRLPFWNQQGRWGGRWTCLPRSRRCDSGGSLGLSEPRRPGMVRGAPCLPPSRQRPPLGDASCPPQRGRPCGPGPMAGRLQRAHPAQPCPALPSPGAPSLPAAGCLPFSRLQVDPCPSDSSRMCEAVVWCPSGRSGVSGLGTPAQGRPRETLANEHAGLQGGRAAASGMWVLEMSHSLGVGGAVGGEA